MVILDKEEPSEPPPYSSPKVMELDKVIPVPSMSRISVITGNASTERSIIPATEKIILSAPPATFAALMASLRLQ